MKREAIRLAITGVMLFLIFKKTYHLLMGLLIWVNTYFHLENKTAIISLMCVTGLISVIVLIKLASRYLDEERKESKYIYQLIAISVLLTLLAGIKNKILGSYFASIDMRDYDIIYFFQYGWSTNLLVLFSILILLYFIRKLHSISTKR